MKTQDHIRTALDLLNAADMDFIALDDRKGSEKLCAAAESALTAAAHKRGWESDDLKAVAARLSEECGDSLIKDGFGSTDLFRLNVEYGIYDEFALDLNLPGTRHAILRAAALASEDGAVLDERPPLGPRDHARIALRMLDGAEREFADRDNPKGSAKISAAADHAITAIAKKRGLPSDSPEDLSAVVCLVKAESADPDAARGFAAVELFRLNARLNMMDKTAIDLSVPDAREFVRRMAAMASESEGG